MKTSDSFIQISLSRGIQVWPLVGGRCLATVGAGLLRFISAVAASGER
jgi:hypothetical protein